MFTEQLFFGYTNMHPAIYVKNSSHFLLRVFIFFFLSCCFSSLDFNWVFFSDLTY